MNGLETMSTDMERYLWLIVEQKSSLQNSMCCGLNGVFLKGYVQVLTLGPCDHGLIWK